MYETMYMFADTQPHVCHLYIYICIYVYIYILHKQFPYKIDNCTYNLPHQKDQNGQSYSSPRTSIHRRLVGIVAAVDWVCCSQNGGPVPVPGEVIISCGSGRYSLWQ